jgi:hypothetical protein
LQKGSERITFFGISVLQMISQRRPIVELINKAKLNDSFVGLSNFRSVFSSSDALFGLYLIVVKSLRREKAIGFGETSVAVANDVAFES